MKITNRIDGGAIIWARQTIDSKVFYDKPDKWFKIWFYLIAKANHTDNKQFSKGSCFMKYEWIMEKTKATKSEVDHCIRWLKSATMIATQKATRGFTVDVLKYPDFQNLQNYKSDTKSDSKSETKAKQKRNKSDTINKNDKDIYSLFKFWNSLEITVHKNIDSFKPNLNASLKIYSEEEIKDAMKNYANIVHNKDYYWDHRYKLDNFLTRKGNIDRFLSVNKPLENWLANKKQKEIVPPYLEE